LPLVRLSDRSKTAAASLKMFPQYVVHCWSDSGPRKNRTAGHR